MPLYTHNQILSLGLKDVVQGHSLVSSRPGAISWARNCPGRWHCLFIALPCQNGLLWTGQVWAGGHVAVGSSKVHLSPYRRLMSYLPSPAPELSFSALKHLGKDALLSFLITSHHLGILKGAEVKRRTRSLRPLFQKQQFFDYSRQVQTKRLGQIEK